MADDRAIHATTSCDERVTAEAGSHQNVVRIELPRESPWKQPAIYVAALALIVATWSLYAKQSAIDNLRADERTYRNDISMWETDVFNHDKSIEAFLQARGIDTSKFGKLKPPPE